MILKFSEILRKLREDGELSQKQLGKKMFVNNSAIARWENGSRLPNAAMIARLAQGLGIDANSLFQPVAQSEGSPNIIMVDDNKVILSDGLHISHAGRSLLPRASVPACAAAADRELAAQPRSDDAQPKAAFTQALPRLSCRHSSDDARVYRAVIRRRLSAARHRLRSFHAVGLQPYPVRPDRAGRTPAAGDRSSARSNGCSCMIVLL